ncbi:MAG: inositol monophosphatase [Pseudomonadota bacterium]
MSVLAGPEVWADRIVAARDVAQAAGQRALAGRAEAGFDGPGIDRKGPQDFVTAFDKAAEDEIRTWLLGRFPDDHFVGEETGGLPGDGPTWVVDPIDGTTNFVRGFPFWAVSIALVSGGQIVGGVIHDAPRDVTYWAVRGVGAFRDDIPLTAATDVDVADAMVILGSARKADIAAHLGLLDALHASGAEHRRFGSAALALALVAEGAADGYYEASLNAWDALAGMCIAAEAGAMVSAPPLEMFLAGPGPVLAGAPALTDVIAAAIPAERRNRLRALRT